MYHLEKDSTEVITIPAPYDGEGIVRIANGGWDKTRGFFDEVSKFQVSELAPLGQRGRPRPRGGPGSGRDLLLSEWRRDDVGRRRGVVLRRKVLLVPNFGQARRRGSLYVTESNRHRIYERGF